MTSREPYRSSTVCIDCGGSSVEGPDLEGFIDCFDCGAAWIPGVATRDVS